MTRKTSHGLPNFSADPTYSRASKIIDLGLAIDEIWASSESERIEWEAKHIADGWRILR